jgi:hypothetical protein
VKICKLMKIQREKKGKENNTGKKKENKKQK